MIVISDTTPIISLIKAGHLDLLERLFMSVEIPAAVYDELTCNPRYAFEANLVKSSSFLHVKRVTDLKFVSILRQRGLDNGESEAIALANETNLSLLLIDERRGRQVAEEIGVRITGTVGIILQAYDEKMLTAQDVIGCVDMLQKSNIRLSKTLYDYIAYHISREIGEEAGM